MGRGFHNSLLTLDRGAASGGSPQAGFDVGSRSLQGVSEQAVAVGGKTKVRESSTFCTSFAFLSLSLKADYSQPIPQSFQVFKRDYDKQSQ